MNTEFIGPFTEKHKVSVDGCVVRGLTVEPCDNGEWWLVLDGRFGVQAPEEELKKYIWLIANALAIGAGYTYHGPNAKISNPFAVQIMGISPEVAKSADIVEFTKQNPTTPAAE